MKDYVLYSDTDSLFLSIEEFLMDNGVTQEQWDKLTDDQKTNYVIQISKEVEKYVNDCSFERLQKEVYNSQVTDFKISWKQEMTMKSVLFVEKKKYGYHNVNKEGVPKDQIDVTGLEIIRSETPVVFRKALNKVLELILKNTSDKEIMKYVNSQKKHTDFSDPLLICANIGVNNIDKYLVGDDYIKGTPYHVKGVSNYRKLLKILGIQKKYRDIHEGEKARVTYVKNNPHKITIVTFYDWPKEFTSFGIEVDVKVQMEKFFLKKVEYLLSPMGREAIMRRNQTSLGAFF